MSSIGAVWMILDLVANCTKQNNCLVTTKAMILEHAGIAANMVCLSKRMILSEGLSLHLILDFSGFWFNICSYAFFGLLSGVVGAASMKLIRPVQTKKSKIFLKARTIITIIVVHFCHNNQIKKTPVLTCVRRQGSCLTNSH